MEGAKRKIHRLRNSLSHRLSSTEVGHQDGHALLSSNGSPRTLSNAKSGSQGGAQNDLARENGDSRNLPKSFVTKKQRILDDLAVPDGEYNDKSPKGSVDEGVKELINLVNGSEGWVTTSSCAGRVSVFVEGRRDVEDDVVNDQAEGLDDEGVKESDAAREQIVNGVGDAQGGDDADQGQVQRSRKVRTGPGGKGGGRWLYVSHGPIPTDPSTTLEDEHFTTLFGLEPMTSSTLPHSPTGQPPRLIHLTYSPLILHVLAATLHHARPLLAAAINAGFRESGVQSLKALEDEEAGVMIGIRTAGLVFDSVIGVVVEGEDGEEKMQAIVSEDYLEMCVEVITGRFVGNEIRKQRLIKEGETAVAKETEGTNDESEEDRKLRKKEQGLKRQQEIQDERSKEKEEETNGDVLEGGLDLPAPK